MTLISLKYTLLRAKIKSQNDDCYKLSDKDNSTRHMKMLSYSLFSRFLQITGLSGSDTTGVIRVTTSHLYLTNTQLAMM